MNDNPNAHKPCKVRDHLPMVQDSTYGKKPFYQLKCECGAIEVYDFSFGGTASTQRCYRCCGLAFGLRKRSAVTAEVLMMIGRRDG